LVLGSSAAWSPWPGRAESAVESWLKQAAFYVILVTSFHTRRDAERLMVGFVAVVMLYAAHSLREFFAGRHTYRMGIVRMLGVDSALGDPNSFAATLLYTQPLLVWAYQRGHIRWSIFVAVFLLFTSCLALTGSRSGFLGLCLWGGFEIVRSSHRALLLCLLTLLVPVGFQILPEPLQKRLETLIDAEAGPQSAQISAQGRLQGLEDGWRLFQQYPLTGCGPGAWRPATHSAIESHSLYGQLLGETGLIGTAAFLCVLAAFWRTIQLLRRADTHRPLASALGLTLILMLFEGFFGHNLFRYTWLWLAAFLVIAERDASDEPVQAIQRTGA
jgi:O-antigen ligase